MKKYYDGEVFIIDEKDSELFERAKEQSDDIYFLIENLEFLRVGFVIESDMKKEILERAKNVNFERDIDEKYAGGLYDLSLELEPDNMEKQEKIYNEMWEIIENEIKEIEKWEKNTQDNRLIIYLES